MLTSRLASLLPPRPVAPGRPVLASRSSPSRASFTPNVSPPFSCCCGVRPAETSFFASSPSTARLSTQARATRSSSRSSLCLARANVPASRFAASASRLVPTCTRAPRRRRNATPSPRAPTSASTTSRVSLRSQRCTERRCWQACRTTWSRGGRGSVASRPSTTRSTALTTTQRESVWWVRAGCRPTSCRWCRRRCDVGLNDRGPLPRPSSASLTRRSRRTSRPRTLSPTRSRAAFRASSRRTVSPATAR
mmetsp:Transcript_4561/g.14775  ORF Transcript_4561/g.14775 Transcript_4561/m.14775 type:complete len:250 (-) Transcript_4561:1275-2024(-)